MSFLAQLEIDNEIYTVLDCIYNFNQSIDKNNKPSSISRGGQITFIIESRGKENFLKWMTEYTHAKDGKITFYKLDQMSRLFELSFTKAYCIDYQEHFEHKSDEPMQIKMTISTKDMKADNALFGNKWAVA
ncbi:type VI secretion system tube protein TssD (plasmid) [Bernardetia sp. Wsw4-3y2]|uniref:type VI secretion system tube protein TssD n=1 Tax=Bernardetia sp. Wsw4-3y2 TaxID=3127471 RepID=UPI0030D60EA1